MFHQLAAPVVQFGLKPLPCSTPNLLHLHLPRLGILMSSMHLSCLLQLRLVVAVSALATATLQRPHLVSTPVVEPAIFSIADQIRRNESALTAPAAGVRLQPAPAMAPLGPAVPNQAGRYGRALTYGRGNNSQLLQGLAANAAQRRVVTIRDPSNASSVASLQPSIASTSDTVTDGPGPAIQVAPNANSPLNITRLRPSTVASPHKHGTDGNASIDDQLDEIFGLYTDEPTRMAMSAGMNMRTESAGTLAPPSTPPAQSAVPAPALRRSPAREYLNTAFEFDEGLDTFEAEGTPVAPPIVTKFGPSASARRLHLAMFRLPIAASSPLVAASTALVTLAVELTCFLNTDLSRVSQLATLVQWVMDLPVDAFLLRTLALRLLVALLRSATPSLKVLPKLALVVLPAFKHAWTATRQLVKMISEASGEIGK